MSSASKDEIRELVNRGWILNGLLYRCNVVSLEVESCAEPGSMHVPTCPYSQSKTCCIVLLPSSVFGMVLLERLLGGDARTDLRRVRLAERQRSHVTPGEEPGIDQMLEQPSPLVVRPRSVLEAERLVGGDDRLIRVDDDGSASWPVSGVGSVSGKALAPECAIDDHRTRVGAAPCPLRAHHCGYPGLRDSAGRGRQQKKRR